MKILYRGSGRGIDRMGLQIASTIPVMLAEALDRLLTDLALRDWLTRGALVKVEERFTIDPDAGQLMTPFQRGGPCEEALALV